MTWLTLRLQRGELMVLLVAAIGLFAAFAATRSDAQLVARPVAVDGTCRVPLTILENGESVCQPDGGVLYSWVNSAVAAFVVLPLIIAILLAIPLVTELHARSYRLAWTQSATRSQWARSRFGVMLLTALALTAATIWLVRWWTVSQGPWWQLETFDALGVVNIGWTIFALGLMVAVGTILRRPLIALVIGAVGYGLGRAVFIEGIRPRLIPPREAHLPLSEALPGDPWVIDRTLTQPDGTRLSFEQLSALCPWRGIPGSSTQENFNAANQEYLSCVDTRGIMSHYTFQPESRYWFLQFAETGILIAVGAALLGWSAWFLVRRLE